jgi:hypothetical protein
MRTIVSSKRGLTRVVAAATALSLLVGCGGGGGGGSAVPPTLSGPTTTPATPTPAPVSVVSTQAATATFTVSVPIRSTSALLRSPKFVSPSTQSVLFTVQSVNGVSVPAAPYDLDVTASNPACVASGAVLTCTANLPIQLAANNNAAQNAVIQVATYPQTGGQGAVLGQSNVGVTLYANAQNRISLTVAGVIAGFYLILSSQKGTAGTASTSNLAVVPTDASGAIITGSGPFSSPIQLTTNNPHVLLSLNGGAGSQSVTVSSFTDVVQLQYDGNSSVPFGTVTGTASGVSGSAVVTYAIARTALSLSAASGTPYVNANGVVFDAPSETTSVTIAGGLAPYTASSASSAIATASISGSTLNVTAQAFGSTSVVVTDAAGAQQTVIVAVSAPQLAPPTNFTNPNYNPTSGQFTFTGPGQSTSFTIVGGQPPFQATSSNPAVISATQTGQTLSSTARAKRAYATTFQLSTGGYGVAVLTFTDASGKTFQIPAVVTATPLTAVGSGTGFANGAFTFGAIGATGVITPASGAPPYTCSSSATAVATATLDPKGLTCIVTTVGYGSAVAAVADSNGSVVPFLVTNSPATFAYTITGGASSYNTTSKSFLFTGALGQTATFTLSGGVTPYSVTAATVLSSQSSAPVGVTNAGGTYTLTTQGYGQSLVTITSANNVGFTIPVTVAPSQLQVGASASGGGSYASSAFTFSGTTGQSGSLALSGGAAPYTCTSASASIATASIVGPTCTITPVGFGTTAITVKDASGQSAVFNVQVTAATLALGVPTAPITNKTIAFNGSLGLTGTIAFYGGVPPYSASATIAGIVSTPTVSGGVATFTTTGYGLTAIVIRDSSGQSITVPVSVSSSASGLSAIATAPSYSGSTTTAPPNLIANGALTFTTLPQTFNLGISGGTGPYTLTAPSGVTLSSGSTAFPAPSGVTLTGNARTQPSLSVNRGPAGTRGTRGTSGSTNSVTSTNGTFYLTITDTPANYAVNSLVVTDSANNTLTIPYSVQAQKLTPSGTSLYYNSTSNSYAFTALGQTSIFQAVGGYPPYTYATSNGSVASITPGGSAAAGVGQTVTAAGYGSTTITATDSRGNVTTVPVTVAPTTALIANGSGSGAIFNGATNTITFNGTSGSATLTLAGGTGSYQAATVTDGTIASVTGTGTYTITPLKIGSTPFTVTDGVTQKKFFVVVNALGTTPLAISANTTVQGETYAGSNLFLLAAIPASGTSVSFSVSGGTGPYTATYPISTTSVTGSSAARRPRIVGTPTPSPAPTAQPTGSTVAANGNFTFTIPSTGTSSNPYVTTITDSKGTSTTVAFVNVSNALTASITSTTGSATSYGNSPARINAPAPLASTAPTWTVSVSGGSGTYSASSNNTGIASVAGSGSQFVITGSTAGTALVTVTDSVVGSSLVIPIVLTPGITVGIAPGTYALAGTNTLTLGVPPAVPAATATPNAFGSAALTVSGGSPPYTAGVAGGTCPFTTSANKLPGTSPTFSVTEDPGQIAALNGAQAICSISVTDSGSPAITQSVTIIVLPKLSYSTPAPASPVPQISFSASGSTAQITVSGGKLPYTLTSGPLSPAASPNPYASPYVNNFYPTGTVSTTTPEVITDGTGESLSIPLIYFPFTATTTNDNNTTVSGGLFGTNYITAVYPPAASSVTPSVNGLFSAFNTGRLLTVSNTCTAFTTNTISQSPQSTTLYGGYYSYTQGFTVSGATTTPCFVHLTDALGTTYTYEPEVLQLQSPTFGFGNASGGSVDTVDTTGRTLDFGGTGQTVTLTVLGAIGNLCGYVPTIGTSVVTVAGGAACSANGFAGVYGPSGFTLTAQSAGVAQFIAYDTQTGAQITVNLGVTTLGLNVQTVRKTNAPHP